MSAAFDWSRHVCREALAVPIPRHRQYGSKIVAANNEFIHPIVEDLFTRFCRDFDPERIRHYPDHQPIIERVARHLRRPSGQVLLTAGSDAAIQILLATLGSTSGRLLLQWPNYLGFETYARLHGMAIDRVPTFGISEQEAETRLARAMDEPAPSLVAITNPSGIDGSCLPADALARIAKAALGRGHILIIDEAYASFGGIDHHGLLDCPNVVILHSFSKSAGLAGLRVGAVLFGDSFAADYVRRWSPGNPVSAVAGGFLAFCLDRIAEIEAARREIASCREWVREQAAALLPDWSVPASYTNFVYLEAPDPASNAVLVGAFEDAGIAVRDVTRMVESANAVRITVGHRAVSERIVGVIKSVVRAPQRQGCTVP